MEFVLQPSVYATGGAPSLLTMLDSMWIKNHTCGEGTLYIISGFANYNGGVRFYPYFSKHIQDGGNIEVILSGSKSQNLSSQQVVKALLECGAEVHIVNCKRLLHAKCYGFGAGNLEEIIVSSGNFTGPGMSQNAEASIYVDHGNVQQMKFSWPSLVANILGQKWDIYHLVKSDIGDATNPAWDLLYDEVNGTPSIDESQEMTMVVTLSHSDTARIQASKGSNAGLGTQYFWLSKGSFDFFPALTERNKRGVKNTYSCMINVSYIDLGITRKERVTFEADNNLDFRLGTSALKYTKIADKDDLAIITRIAEYDYELRIIRKDGGPYSQLRSYATSFIGGCGKKFGYLSNEKCYNILGVNVGS